MKFLVRVNCKTFNHASYIEDALNGFCMQETSFPFVCAIFDDASTDGESDVINLYLKNHFDLNDTSIMRQEETDDYRFIFARHKVNHQCYFAVYLLKYNHYSIKKPMIPYLPNWGKTKYIAICEGDDYWVNPKKLQIQVDFMESFPKYSICHGCVDKFNSDNQKYHGKNNWLSKNNNLNETNDLKKRFYRVINGYYSISTPTVLFRTSSVTNRVTPQYNFMMGDTPLWIDITQNGQIHYFDELFSVYRIHHGSSTHNPKTRKRFTLSKYEMRIHYCELYQYPVTSKLKKLYNRAYIDLLTTGKQINPAPIYAPFVRNPLQGLFLNMILKKEKFYGFYSKILHPIKKYFILAGKKIDIAFKLIYNLVPLYKMKVNYSSL